MSQLSTIIVIVLCLEGTFASRSTSTSIDGTFEDNTVNNANVNHTWTKTYGNLVSPDAGRLSATTNVYYHGPYQAILTQLERNFSCVYDATINVQFRVAYRRSDALDGIALYIDDVLLVNADLGDASTVAAANADLSGWAGANSDLFYEQNLSVAAAGIDVPFVLAQQVFSVRFEGYSTDSVMWSTERKFVGGITIECVRIPPTEIDTVFLDDGSNSVPPQVWTLESAASGGYSYDAQLRQSPTTLNWYHGPFPGSAVDPVTRLYRSFQCASDAAAAAVSIEYEVAYCSTQDQDTVELLLNGESQLVTSLGSTATRSNDNYFLSQWDPYCSSQGVNIWFHTVDRLIATEVLTTTPDESFTVEFKVTSNDDIEAVYIGDVQVRCSSTEASILSSTEAGLLSSTEAGLTTDKPTTLPTSVPSLMIAITTLTVSTTDIGDTMNEAPVDGDSASGNNQMTILIPSITLPILCLFCLAAAFYYRWRDRKRQAGLEEVVVARAADPAYKERTSIEPGASEQAEQLREMNVDLSEQKQAIAENADVVAAGEAVARASNLNVHEYALWSSDDIVDWMVSLDATAYSKYEQGLRCEFGLHEIDGETLQKRLLTATDFERYCENAGIKKFMHRREIFLNIEKLVNGEYVRNEVQMEGEGEAAENADNQGQTTSSKWDAYQIQRGDDM